MKIGIMSLYFKTYNYGAQLQAYALQKAIAKLGFECEQLCYKWQDAHIENVYHNRLKNLNKFREFAFNIPHSKNVYDPSNIYDANDNYDIFITGSDQVWGVTESMPRYVVPHMSLSFANEEKMKIAYGASFGSAKITTERIPVLKYWTSKLDRISMREQSALPQINELSGKEAVSVLDPTFLIDRSEWDSLIHPKTDEEDYILVYNMGRNEELEKAANKLSEKTCYVIKSASYFDTENVGPIEFLSLIKNAKYVLTNSFHGTCFSIIFEKQFFVFPVDNIQSEFSKNIRITDLLEKIGEKARFVSKADEFDFEKLIDYKKVNDLLSLEKVKSLEFLKSSIELKKDLPKRVIPIKECYGCGVCAVVCPQKCISFAVNDVGFRYPVIEKEKCVECGYCRERCPSLQTEINNNDSYALINNNLEIRKSSSSGGAFSAFAEYIIEHKGVVFGVKYDDNFNVINAYVENMDNAANFRGSKYVESDLKNTFEEAKAFLEKGRIVLFSGCGCQINALKSFLDKEYENLYTVDLICGGVVGKKFWDIYLNQHQNKYGTLNSINQRTKELGYLNSIGRCAITTTTTTTTTTTDPREDFYMSPRFNFYRENCGYCKIKKNNHKADISIGDCLGNLCKEIDDGNGLSLAIVRNSKGEKLFEYIKDKITAIPLSYEDVCASNSMIENNLKPKLWKDYITAYLSYNNKIDIFYEHKLCESNFDLDNMKRKFNNEVKRNSLHLRILKYQMYGCVLEDEPFINGDVIIYGAGKVGKVLSDCTDSNIVFCFLESTDRLQKVNGIPVYLINSDEIKEKLNDKSTTIIITPVWDFEEVYQNIHNIFPNANIISVEKVVEKLWE